MLDPARVHTSETQRVPVGPDRAWMFTPGVAKSFEELGVTKTEGMALVKEHGLRLIPAKAETGSFAGDTITDSDTGEATEPAAPLEDEVGGEVKDGD